MIYFQKFICFITWPDLHETHQFYLKIIKHYDFNYKVINLNLHHIHHYSQSFTLILFIFLPPGLVISPFIFQRRQSFSKVNLLYFSIRCYSLIYYFFIILDLDDFAH
jgi:hypothetical protein